MIQSLLMFDQYAIFSPRASIRVELDEMRSSWNAGEELYGQVILTILQPTDGMAPFPSSALTLQLLGIEET